MAWETRERGGRYYTRSRKVGGRVVREYVGTGPLAEITAALDSLDRIDRREAALAIRVERERLEEIDKPLARLCELADTLARSALMAAGYHQHNRGEWRRRRDMTPKTDGLETRQELEKRLTDELHRANEGEEPALSDVRERLNAKPEYWELIFGVARQAEAALVNATAGEGKLTAEAHRRGLAEMKDGLTGPNCSPLERVLAERVAVCWLQVQHADAVYYSSIGDVDLKLGAYYQQRQDRAHRRFLAAVKALATVRKLALPVVQVNVAEQQINLAG